MLVSLTQGSIPETFILAEVEQTVAVTTQEMPTKAVELYDPLATLTPEVGS